MSQLDNKRRFFITTDVLSIGFGNLEFKKVSDYEIVTIYMPLLQVAEHQVKQACLDSAKELGTYSESDLNKLLAKLRKTSMISLIQQNPLPLRHTPYSRGNYEKMFGYFFNDFESEKLDWFKSNKEFDQIRDLIIESHGQEPDREPINATLADYNRKQKELMMKSGQSASFEAMYTSVYAYTGDDPKDMTMYKFHKLFERINRIFNYESNVFLRPYMSKDAGDIKPFYADAEDSRKKISREQLGLLTKSKTKI